jgi:hypothetical protein
MRHLRVSLLVAALLAGWMQKPLAQSNWVLRNPLPTINSLNSIAYLDGRIFAVGSDGTIIFSDDGIAWTVAESGTKYPLSTVIKANGTLVVTGGGGPILISKDGFSWKKAATPESYQFYTAAWTGSRFLALGNYSTGTRDSGAFYSNIFSSQDGSEWVPLHPEGANLLSNFGILIRVGSRMVALGESIASSENGLEWTERAQVGEDYPASAVWNGSLCVAVGRRGAVFSSPDGITWTKSQSGTEKDLSSITWTGSLFIANSYNGATVTSSDGMNWSVRDTNPDNFLSGVAWVGDRVLGVGFGGSMGTLNGDYKWELRPRLEVTWTSLVWGDEKFVAVGLGGMAGTSPDGKAWSFHPIGLPKEISQVIWTGKSFFAIGRFSDSAGAVVFTSPDGNSWSKLHLDYSLNTIAWTGISLVAIDVYGNARISQDGQTWSTHPMAAATANFDKLLWNGTQLIASGNLESGEGVLYTSTDGTAWHKRFQGKGPLGALASSGGMSIAFGSTEGYFVTSQDGETWTERKADFRSVNDACWTGRQFVGVGFTREYAPIVVSSTDGVEWRSTASPPGNWSNPTAISCHDGKIVTAGSAGAIITLDEDTPVAVSKKSAISRHSVLASVDSRGISVLLPSGMRGTEIHIQIYTLDGKRLREFRSKRAGAEIFIPLEGTTGAFLVHLGQAASSPSTVLKVFR